jgi:hypothetical protein
MGIALWMPYYGSGMYPGDVYRYRSCIFPASRIGMDTRKKNQDYVLLKKMRAESQEVEKYLLGDFYPLTAHSLALEVWVGWQFDRPAGESAAAAIVVHHPIPAREAIAAQEACWIDWAVSFRIMDGQRRGGSKMSKHLTVTLPSPTAISSRTCD